MEVELKYVVPDYETFEQLLSLTHLGDYWLRPAGDKQVTDHYYDTAQRDALQGGYSVRLREDAQRGKWVGTLKGLAQAAGATGGDYAAGQHEREEYESPVAPGAPPQAWPEGPARERALQLVGDRPVQELFAIGQERHKRMVISGEGEQAREAAELSLDVVSLPRNGHQRVIYELEIELLPGGTRDDLLAFGEALGGFQLAPQPQSKFARALAIVDGKALDGNALEGNAAHGQPAAEPQAADVHVAEAQAAELPVAELPVSDLLAVPEQAAETETDPQAAAPAKPARPKTPGVRADESMAQAGRKVLRFHFDRMLDQEPGVRAGEDIEAVHDMRVATRRQRAALALFAAHFKPKAVRRLGAELKKLAHLLGGVRDLDVQLKATQDYRARLAAPEAEALQPVLDAWSAERDTARAALLAHLDSRTYRDFKKAYAKFQDHTHKAPARQPGDLPAPNLVRQVLPGELWDHYGEVRAYETVMAKADVPTLHALRIASKSLRYAQEFFREVLEPVVGAGKQDGMGFTIEAVVALQDHIGNLHDADVTIARLEAFLQRGARRKAALPPQTVKAIGRYTRAKQAELKRLHRDAHQPWSVVSGAKFRKILGRAVAGL